MRLGTLQKEILLIAHKAHRVRSEYQIDTSIAEILINVYNFPSGTIMAKGSTPGNVFNRQLVGIRRYETKCSIVSRCFETLVTRGLAKRDRGKGFTCGCGSGIKLTGEGMSAAEGIRQKMYRARHKRGGRGVVK